MMNLFKRSMNKKGQTIVEALVALGLLSFVGLTFAGGMSALRNASSASLLGSSTDRQISDIAENIKAGMQNYQVNFAYYDSTKINQYLDPKNLPMAWDIGKVDKRVNCTSCAGTFGYVIQPYEKYRGLYLVTLRMTHKTWEAKGEPYRDYTFVVSAK